MRRSAAVLIAAFGCAEEVIVLPLDPETRSILWFFELEPFAVAVDPELVFIAPRHDDRSATALLYQRTLEELHLEPGALRAAAPGESSRRIPKPDQIYAAGDAAFMKLDRLPEELENFRLPAPDYEACLKQGGCFPGDQCTVPCPRAEDPRAPEEPDSPAGPTPPSFECRGRWIKTPDGCIPPDRHEHERCGELEAHFFEDPAGCIPFGTNCPSDGPYAENLPADREIRYVNSLVAEGDEQRGTIEHPYRTITQAATATPADAVIALAKGNYAENATLTGTLEVIGPCARDAQLFGEMFLGERAQLIDVRVRGELRVDVHADGAKIRGVLIDQAGPLGIVVGGSVEIRDVVIRGRSQAIGIEVEVEDRTLPAEVLVSRVVIEDFAEYGISAVGDRVRLVVEQTVADGRPWASDDEQQAIFISDESEAGIEDVELHALNALAVAERSTLIATSVFIGRLEQPPERGIVVSGGSTVTLDRTSIQAANQAALWVIDSTVISHNLVSTGAGSAVLVSSGNVLADDLLIQGPGIFGIHAVGGGSIRVSDVVVRGGSGAAIAAERSALAVERAVISAPGANAILGMGGANVMLRDVLISDVPPPQEISAITAAGGSLNAERVRVKSSDPPAIVAAAAEVALADIEIEGVSNAVLHAIQLSDARSLKLERLRLRDVLFGAINVSTQGEAQIAHVWIEDSRQAEMRGALQVGARTGTISHVHIERTLGSGLRLDSTGMETIRVEHLDVRDADIGLDAVSTKLDLEQARFLECRTFGVRIGRDTSAEVRELYVGQTRRIESAGIVVEAELELSRFAIEGGEGSGAFISSIGPVQFSSGRIVDHHVGVTVFEEFDLRSLLDGVVFERNDQNVVQLSE